MGKTVSNTTLHSMKRAYLEEKREKRRAEDDGDVTVLLWKNHGQLVLLGEELDEKMKMYLQKVRDGGGVVTGRIAIAAAQGLLLSCDKAKLAEFGGHVTLTNQWAYSLLNRMDVVQRKATTAKSKHTPENFSSLRNYVATTVLMEDIPQNSF